MAGGLVGLQQHMESQALNTLGQVAREEEANKRLEEQMDQAKSAQTMGSAATGAMIGFQVAGPVGGAVGALGGWLLGDLL